MKNIGARIEDGILFGIRTTIGGAVGEHINLKRKVKYSLWIDIMHKINFDIIHNIIKENFSETFLN